jgi:hypothetical protein
MVTTPQSWSTSISQSLAEQTQPLSINSNKHHVRPIIHYNLAIAELELFI